MTFDRRTFLGALVGAQLIVASRWTGGASAQTSGGAGAPVLTNHQGDGRPLLREGRTLLLTLAFPSPVASLTGDFAVRLEPESAGGKQLTESQPLFFYAVAGGRTFRTILSAPLDSVEGTHELRLVALLFGETVRRWSFPYTITRGVFRESVLTLDQNFSSPPPDVAARMRHDFETMVEIYGRRTERRWQAPFVRPVPGPDKENFGVRRVVNGTKRYRHAGLDYRAAVGTPVRAINDATVALSAEQWTPGQTICLDHGGGIFSKYLHLSERRVREGEAVTRGQIIALSGNSGGQKPPPHLHMDLVINGTHVDPNDFMNTAAQMLVLEGK